MTKKIKDKERDSIDFGKTRIEPLFNSIFYPTLLSMVFASLFTVADGIFVGQGVGSNALAAINIVSPLFLITTGLALMFGVGVSVVASIHLSQNNNKAANINITQAFDVATLLMVIIALAVFLFRIPFLRLLGSSDALLPLCQAYLLAILPGCICIVIQMIGTFVIRLDGSPKFAASLEIFPGLLNIFLDWLFVFPMQMGIAGSGIASSISCAAAAGMVVWYMFFRAKTVRLFRLKLSRTSLYLTARNVAIIGYFQATEQNTRATLCMLFRGLVFLVPAFILMPIFIYPQGMWLAVPVAECMTPDVILLTNKGIISR